MTQSETTLPTTTNAGLDFLWMELTNQCNLRCGHCYSESSPTAKDVDPLSPSEQIAVLADSYQIGCRKVQFIGGEPTLNKNLGRLIGAARRMGYELVEVYTNLVHLSDDLLRCFLENEVCLATSAYSGSQRTHDLITKTPRSFSRTMANLRKVVSLGLKVRVSIIEMAENASEAAAAADFLTTEIGIEDLRIDRVRPFGRAGDAAAGSLGDLCGSCAGGTLCVAPDGEVAPCIMSKKWSVGSVRRQSLSELVGSDRLTDIRAEIRDAVRRTQLMLGSFDQPIDSLEASMNCAPNNCAPVIGCPPLNKCGPDINRTNFLHRSEPK